MSLYCLLERSINAANDANDANAACQPFRTKLGCLEPTLPELALISRKFIPTTVREGGAAPLPSAELTIMSIRHRIATVTFPQIKKPTPAVLDQSFLAPQGKRI